MSPFQFNTGPLARASSCFVCILFRDILDCCVVCIHMNNKRCDLLVWGLRSLIHEMQGSQVYVDKDGAVKRRVRPKDMLNTVHRHRRHHPTKPSAG